jgi:uncharacterized protein DUF5684
MQLPAALQEPAYDAAALLAPMLGLWALLCVYAIAAYVVNGVFLSKIFVKTGAEGWPAWVPIYNSWRLLELGALPGWLALLALVPIVNVAASVFLIIAVYRVGLGFGKSGVWAVLFCFVPLVWAALLAYGRVEPWRSVAVPSRAMA